MTHTINHTAHCNRAPARNRVAALDTVGRKHARKKSPLWTCGVVTLHLAAVHVLAPAFAFYATVAILLNILLIPQINALTAKITARLHDVGLLEPMLGDKAIERLKDRTALTAARLRSDIEDEMRVFFACVVCPTLVGVLKNMTALYSGSVFCAAYRATFYLNLTAPTYGTPILTPSFAFCATLTALSTILFTQYKKRLTAQTMALYAFSAKSAICSCVFARRAFLPKDEITAQQETPTRRNTARRLFPTQSDRLIFGYRNMRSVSRQFLLEFNRIVATIFCASEGRNVTSGQQRGFCHAFGARRAEKRAVLPLFCYPCRLGRELENCSHYSYDLCYIKKLKSDYNFQEQDKK